MVLSQVGLPLDLFLVVGIIAIAIFVVWAEVLYWLAGKDKKNWFWTVFSIGTFSLLVSAINQIWQSVDLWAVAVGIITLTFLIFVGATVYEQAGNRERRWYYLTLVFPVLAIVYQFTKK